MLTGVAIYLAAAPSSTDGDFLAWSAVLLAVAGLLTAALLAWLAGLRSWWFALAPPLVLYAFHNWDLFAVCATVLAFWVLIRAGRARSDDAARPRTAERGETGSGGIDRVRPLVLAAVALGIGGAFKLYPMMFALPIALWLGTGGWLGTGRRLDSGGRQGNAGLAHPTRLRWLMAAAFAVGTGAVFLVINLPFMIAGFTGWWASFQFQWSRPIDLTTNTIWFWGARPYSDSNNAAVQHDLATAATVTTLAALLLACALGFLRLRNGRRYPWLPVCAAMICGYLLFNKVHSRSSCCGYCRSSCCCGSGQGGSWPTLWRTRRSASGSSDGNI